MNANTSTSAKLVQVTEEIAKAILFEQRNTQVKVYADPNGEQELALKTYGTHLFLVHRNARTIVEFDNFYTAQISQATNTYLRSGKWSAEHGTHQRNVNVVPTCNVRDVIASAITTYQPMPKHLHAQYGPQSVLATANTPVSVGDAIAELHNLATKYELNLLDASDTLTDPTDQATIYKFILGNQARNIAAYTVYIRRIEACEQNKPTKVAPAQPLPNTAKIQTLQHTNYTPTIYTPPVAPFTLAIGTAPLNLTQQIASVLSWVNQLHGITYSADSSTTPTDERKPTYIILDKNTKAQYGRAIAHLLANRFIQASVSRYGQTVIYK